MEDCCSEIINCILTCRVSNPKKANGPTEKDTGPRQWAIA